MIQFARRTAGRQAPFRATLGQRTSGWLSRWALLVVLLIIVGGFSLWLPDTFPRWGNIQDIITSQPPGIFIAFAAMVTLVVREFDLSLGSNLGISQYFVLEAMTEWHLSWPMAVLLTLGVGLTIGGINAALVVGLGLNSFIVTIGVATILDGLLQWMSNGGSPIFAGAPQGFLNMGQTKLAGLTLPVYYALGAAVLLWITLEYTVLGRQLRATGANRQAARLSGVRTRRATVLALLMAGLLASLAGILASARLGSADATSGPAYLLPAFAAAFLGATAVRVGYFNVWGTVIAIFLVAVGITGLQLKGIASWVTPVFNGLVLLLAIAVSHLAAKRQAAGSTRAAAFTQHATPRRGKSQRDVEAKLQQTEADAYHPLVADRAPADASMSDADESVSDKNKGDQ